MFISLVECEKINIASEHESFSEAINAANAVVGSSEYGKIKAAQIFETDEVVMGSNNIKDKCKLIASLRVYKW